VTGERVFKDMRPMLILHKVANEGLSPMVPNDLLDDATRPVEIPAEIVELIRDSIARNPKQRPTFQAICQVFKQLQ